MENNTEIPVVLALDSKYILQSFVVLHSILMKSSGRFSFILISGDDIEDFAEECVKKLEQKYSNFKLLFKKIDASSFANAQIHNVHLSKAAYYRLLIPNILNEYEKCIYLDCDVLVNNDISELYDIDITDYYVAGVKDGSLIEGSHVRIGHQEILKITSMNRYINSGVLLMNLKKMRSDKMVERFMAQAKKENLYEDQDVINVCCYDGIKILPLKYNLFQFYLGKKIDELKKLSCYEAEDFDFDCNHPFILHTVGVCKPWLSERYEGSDQWWNTAEIYRETEVYKKWKNISWSEVVVWGFGKRGKVIANNIKCGEGTKVVAFCDNNFQLLGCEYEGIKVLPVEDVIKRFPKIKWVVSCAYKEVKKQLLELGIEDANIERYPYTIFNRAYLLSVKPCYYQEEIEKMAMYEYEDVYDERRKRMDYMNRIIQNPIQYQKEYADLLKKYEIGQWFFEKIG